MTKTMINADVLQLEGILWYQAPKTHEVRPKEIEDGLEYLELITGGTVYFDVDGERKKFGYGSLFWHMPGDFTIFETEPEDPYECIVFKYCRLGTIERQWSRVSVLADREGACEFGRDMLSAFHNEQMDRNLLTVHAYSWLSWHVHQSVLSQKESSLPVPLTRLVNLIEESPGRDFSVDEMSHESGISAPHLHTLFREHLSTTPHRYLLSKRLNLARHLIVGTDNPIKSVAAECGFENVETFYRCFRKHFSSSPGAFRRKNRPS